MSEPWIELDYQISGRPRYTYWGTKLPEATLIRWEWMGDELWAKAKAAFFSNYANVPIRSRIGHSIDTVRDAYLTVEGVVCAKCGNDLAHLTRCPNCGDFVGGHA